MDEKAWNEVKCVRIRDSLRTGMSAPRWWCQHASRFSEFGALFVSLCAPAGSFFSDFNSGTLPAGTAVYGSATNDTTGGYTNSGCIKLTTATGSVSGSFIVGDLDSGQPVDNFVVSFKALV